MHPKTSNFWNVFERCSSRSQSISDRFGPWAFACWACVLRSEWDVCALLGVAYCLTTSLPACDALLAAGLRDVITDVIPLYVITDVITM